MVVVADSSPLIYLSRIGLLEVLESMFGTVVVPPAVWSEVVELRPEAPGVAALLAADWLEVDARELPTVDLGLDAGETEAILLAEVLGAELLLIDERAGRGMARARGIAIRGTLGVLVGARQRGLIVELRPVIDELVEEGFRLAPGLVDAALRAVSEA